MSPETATPNASSDASWRRARRERVVIGTNVGWFKGTAPYPTDPRHIRHQLEESLANLGTDYLDSYDLDNADLGLDDRSLNDAADLLHGLQRQGTIRAIGQSASSFADFQGVCPIVRPNIVQFGHGATGSAFDDPDADVFARAEERGGGTVLFSPLTQGLLLDKIGPEHPPHFGEEDGRAGGPRFDP